MAAQIVLGALKKILASGGITRALATVERAVSLRRSALRALGEVFVDLLPHEIQTLRFFALEARISGQRLTRAFGGERLRDIFAVSIGGLFEGDLAGAIEVINAVIPSPFGGDDIWVQVIPSAGQTVADARLAAAEQAARIINKSPGRFAPSETGGVSIERALTAITDAGDIFFHSRFSARG